MKQWLKTGKKTLSVLMAVIMVMSAWVWVAPTEASAAAGLYDVQIKWYVGDNDMNGNGGAIALHTKANNGTGGETKHGEIKFVNGDTKNKNAWSVTSMIWEDVGFPSAFTMSLYNTTLPRNLGATVYVYVKAAGTTEWSSAVGSYTFDSWDDNSTHEDVSFNITNAPEATDFDWSKTPVAMQCPETGSEPQDVAVTAKDQYGVQMYDPTWSVSGAACGANGISISPATGESATISLTNGANDTTPTDTQKGTVTATWGTVKSSKEFTITDSYYTANFSYEVQNDDMNTSTTKTVSRSGYHGDEITAPTPLSYYDYDLKGTFIGWIPTFSSTIVKDEDYTADYSFEKVPADYSAVDAAIAAADAIKDNYGTEYELKYTLASRAALDYEINEVVRGKGRTQQDVVDGYAQAINDAIAALEPNKYAVIFLDVNGAILLYEKDVEYKEAVTAPTYSATYYDSTNHYTFTGWDTNEYASVTDDLVIQPVFTAEAHSFTTSTVPSTCVQKGATKYTCACGYSYIDGETEYGDHVWATDYTVDLEATCTVAGSKSIHCTLCDAQSDITPIEPHGHNFSSQSIAVDASCEKAGVSTRVCDICGFCEHTQIPALGHSMEKATVVPTCTAKGYDEYTCQREGCYYSYRDNYTDLVEHSYGEWETVRAASCGVAGVKKQICEDCGYVNVGSIAALTHDTPDWFIVVPATCTGEGYKTKTCSKCLQVLESETIPALTHDYTKKSETPATCTQAGVLTETCDRCGDINKTVTDALGHSYDEGVTSEADCTHGGFTTYTCTRTGCGHQYIELVDEALATGHNFEGGTETVIKSATCTEDGQKSIKCINDGCNVLMYEVIPKTGHSHTAGEDVAPTCTTSGYTPYTCSRCGDTYNKYDSSEPANGHTFDETIAENVAVTVDATCTTDGQKSVKCANCGETELRIIPKTGHTYVAGTPVEATCTTSGYTPYTCTCRASYNAYNEDDCASGHNYAEVADSSTATCTAGGTKKLKCDDCQKEITVSVPKLGHEYVEDTTVATTATCAAAATKTYKCSRCDDAYTISVGEKTTEHSFGEWTTVKAATNTSIGYKTRECTVCGKLEVQEIPATGDHVFDTLIETFAATCTADGYKKYDCSVHTGENDCGLTSTVVIPKTGHSTSLVYTPPTCTQAGEVELYCASCDTVLDTQNIPKIAHTYGEGDVTTEPTCTTNGVMTYTCTADGCGATRTEPIGKTGHTLSTVVTDATCTKTGKVVTSCSACDYKIETEIPVIAHTYGEGAVTTEPTCTTDGVKTFTCSCGATRTEAVSKIAHTYTTEVTGATCTTDGSVVTKCSVCVNTFATTNLPSPGHQLVVTVTPATCTAEGSVTEDCKVCDYVKTTTIEKLAHDYSGEETVTKEATCTEDGEKTVECKSCDATTTVTIPKKGHTYPDEWRTEKTATCTEDGKKTLKCNDCDDTKIEIIPKLGHTWGEWVKVDATNDTDGSWTRTCSRGCKETVPIPAGGHEWDNGTVTKEATCTESGTMVYKCTAHTGENACGVTLEVTIPVKQHTVAKEVKNATCTEEGYVKTYCSVCNTVVFTNETTKKIAHTYVAQTAVAPTCTTSGYTPYTCYCGDTYNVYDALKPATGHNYNGVVTTDATCTRDGVMTYTCQNNATHTYTETIPATGHNFEKQGETVAATCTTPSTETYKCSSCVVEYTKYIAPANGHSFGKWEVVTAATADKYGVQKSVCSACSAVEYGVLAPIGDHEFTETVTTEATCTTDGEKTFTCTKHENCAANYTEKIPATGHSGKISYTAPTCTAAGSSKIICETCKEVIESYTIDAKGIHSYGEGVVTTPAGCKSTGIKTYTCTVAGCTATKTETIPAKGHSLSTTVTDAKCGEAGSVVTSCANCTYSETETLAAKGHIWETTPIATTEATCTTDGSKTYKCQFCNETNVVTVAKLGHDWGEWVKVDATNDTDGSWTRTCSRGCKETVVIPKGGHTFDNTPDSTTPATCTATGTATYNCTAHTGENACGVTITVTLDKLQHELETIKIDATCTTDGSVVTKCKNCNTATITTIIPATSHSYGDSVTTAPTCTEEGVRTYTCSKCDASYTQAIAKLQHVFEVQSETEPTCTSSGYITYKCETCTESYKVITDNPKEHTLTQSASTATCLEGGKVTLSCSACTYTKEVDVPALGHDYKKNSTTVASCTAAATETYKCSRCDASYTISVGEKSEHTWSNWSVVAQATETALGYETRSCSICGKLEGREIQPIGAHQFTEETSDKHDPTCTEAGYMVYACSADHNCGLTSKVTLPATGHDTETVTVPATCTTDGSITTTCNNCDYKVVETITAPGHSYGKGTVTAATCKAEGNIEYTCAVCGDKKNVAIPVDSDAHKFKTEITQATCTDAGLVKVTCLNGCGYTEETTIPAKDHTWNSGEVTSEATCTKTGIRELTCVNCGTKGQEIIPALGHSYTADEAVEPTCTTSGYTPYICSCGDTYNVYDASKPANLHDWTEWVVVTKATETKDGLRRRTCKVSGCDGVDEQIIPAMMHSMTETQREESTCETQGYIIYECAVKHDDVDCNYTLKVDLPEVAHTLSTTVTEATCENEGTVVTECSVCDYEITKTLVNKPHDITVTTTPATCTTDGSITRTCNNCDYKVVETITALGHNFNGDETVTKTATCGADGEKTVKCTRCNEVQTVVIPRVSHQFESVSEVEATCTTSGYIVYECKTCDESYNEFVSDPIGHDWDDGTITKKADCTNDGEITYTCKRDGCTGTRTELISKFGHSWGAWTVVTNPTADNDGLQMRKCLREGCTKTESVIIPALGGATTYTVSFVVDGSVIATQTVNHGSAATAPEISGKAPDSENHYSFIWDTDFSRVTKDLTVTAIFTPEAHSFGEWIIDVTATCGNSGAKHRICDKCGYVENVIDPAKEHNYSIVKSETLPTCTENGTITRACENCGEIKTEKLSRLGHAMTYHPYVAETCDSEGTKAYFSCSRCGKMFADKQGQTELTDVTIGKKYHTLIVEPGFEPTCTANGMTDYRYCTSCGYTETSQIIPALGHVDKDNDHFCDRCESAYMEGGEIVCSCSCHKKGIFNEFIYKILSFFWKLFGLNQTCECGKSHY